MEILTVKKYKNLDTPFKLTLITTTVERALNPDYYNEKIQKIKAEKKIEYWEQPFLDIITDQEEKAENNITRAKTNIKEIASCNDWEYFVTLTIDGQKKERVDLEVVKKQLCKFFNNYKERHNPNFKYLIIFEEHKKGGYHAHGFFIGLQLSELTLYNKKEKKYNWDFYTKLYGYNSIIQITGGLDKISSYIVKYISKCFDSNSNKGQRCYICSQRLARAIKIKDISYDDYQRLINLLKTDEKTFSSDYCKTLWIKDLKIV